jgi:hypothetical protein
MTSNSSRDTVISSPIELDSLPDNHSRRLVRDLIERHRYHTKLAKDLNRRYKLWGPSLLIFIPVYSSIISFLTTGVIESRLYLSLLSLLLTIATILNSTLRPDEKFVSSSNVLIKLKDWESDLAISLGEIDKADSHQLYDLIRKKSVELSEIGSSMARTYLPVKNS